MHKVKGEITGFNARNCNVNYRGIIARNYNVNHSAIVCTKLQARSHFSGNYCTKLQANLQGN